MFDIDQEVIDVLNYFISEFIGSCYFHILFLVSVVFILVFKDKNNKINSNKKITDSNNENIEKDNASLNDELIEHVKDEKKERNIKYTLGIYSFVCILILLCPITCKYFIKFTDKSEYHRLMWILPLNIVISYVLAKLIIMSNNKIKKIIACIIAIILVVVSGRFIYPLQKNCSNFYGIADDTFEIINYVSNDDKAYKKIVGPEEIIVYTRQYDASILLGCSRSFNDDSYFYMTLEKQNDKNAWAIKYCDNLKINYLVLYNEDVESFDNYLTQNNIQNVNKVYSGNSMTVYYMQENEIEN